MTSEEQEDKKTILVVDDEPEIATIISLILEMNGYNVIKMHGTAQAMAAVGREHPDLVVLDVMMPGVSGLELSRYIRREPGMENVPIVIVSARGRQEEIEEGMAAGASAYLVKPIGKEELLETVQRLLP